jgi:hypothetical protein
MAEGIASVEVGTRPGQLASVWFQVETPGSYPVECSILRDAAAGMIEPLVVRQAVDPLAAKRARRGAGLVRS